MKIHIRIGSLALAALFVAGACGSAATPSPAASTEPSTAPASSAPAESASASAPASPSGAAALTGTITIWEAYGASGSAEKDAFDKIVGNVKTANPGLTVNVLDVPFNQLFNKFETEAASGGGPDLYIAPNDSLPSEARAGLLKDLTSMIPQLKAAPYNISDTAITADTVDGKLYAIPESMKAVALFYNTSIFPTPPATTDDWIRNASKLGWVYGANGGGSYYMWGAYYAFGGKILDDTGKCVADQGGVADSFKWLQDLKKAGAKFYQNDNDAKADFIAGKIGGFIDGPWQTGDLKKALADKLAVAPGPKATADFQPMAAPDGYYINDASANADLAVQFALQMISASNEQIFVDSAGHIPANTTLTVADPIGNGFVTAIKTGFPRPTAKELNNYWGNFGNAIVSVIDKGTDPVKATADACAAMNKANNK